MMLAKEVVMDDKDVKIEALEDEIRMLREMIERGIEKHCGFFCALPECAQNCIKREIRNEAF